jgi:hypothetical protein
VTNSFKNIVAHFHAAKIAEKPKETSILPEVKYHV